MNDEGEATTGEPVDMEAKTVAELKELLREQDLAVSGTKAQLIERLEANSGEGRVLTLEEEAKVESGGGLEETGPWWRSTDVLTPQALTAIGVVLLMVTAAFVFRPTWLGFAPNYEYELIDFDQDQARTFAEELVAYGHPDWEGRMSGTTEEVVKDEDVRRVYLGANFRAY